MRFPYDVFPTVGQYIFLSDAAQVDSSKLN